MATPSYRRPRWPVWLLLKAAIVLVSCCSTASAFPLSPAALVPPATRRCQRSTSTCRRPLDRRRSSSSSPFHAPHAPCISSTSQLLAPDATAAAADPTALQSVAQALGYLVGAASVLLYTPIAVRMLRNKSADGLAASTWWLKLTSYTCTDVYNIRNGFPLSAFSETLVITAEATIILALVNYFQKRINVLTIAMALTYLVLSAWALLSPSNTLPWGPPDGWIDSAQILATVINVFALVPQLKQNWERGESGDYSPISALLASAGCAVRIFTTVQLAGGDPLLLLNYGVALLLNVSVLFQIVYYGTRKEGKSLVDLFLADVRDSEKVVNAKQLAEETF